MKKRSPYIHKMYNSKQELIILDSLNSKIYRVSEDKAEYIERELENPSEQMKKIFEEKGLYVNENRICGENLYQDYQNNKDYLNIIILPTEQCNFRCTYCYETHEKKTMSQELQKAIVKYVKREISKFDALRVEWFGGEPLCAIDIVNSLSKELINICKEEKKPYYASMTTNGYLLNLDVFKTMFRKNRIVKYQVTLDGLKETHDNQRFLIGRKGTFETIFNNLLEIKQAIKSQFYNITIRCNITKEILRDFDDYVEMITKEFGDDPRFELLWKIAWNPEVPCNRKQEKLSADYCVQDDLHACLSKYNDKVLRFGTNKSQMMKYGNICYASNKNSIIIGSDGKLYKCTVAFDKEVNHVGDINMDGTLTIDADKMNFWTSRKGSMDVPKCEKCSFYPSCLGIYCNLNNENEEGEFVCAGLKNYIDEYLQHISKIDYFVEDLL